MSRRPGSPGAGGYALAIYVSLCTFAAVIALADALGGGTWGDAGVLVLGVLVLGAVPAAAIGTVGCLVVHLVTRGTTHQAWHVAAATLVGTVAGLAVFVQADLTWAPLLGVATGVGRLAVVPLARRAPAPPDVIRSEQPLAPTG